MVIVRQHILIVEWGATRTHTHTTNYFIASSPLVINVLMPITLLRVCVQIAELNANIGLVANFLQRCPSCLSNLVTHICDFTCDARQSTYLQVLTTKNSTIKRE